MSVLLTFAVKDFTLWAYLEIYLIEDDTINSALHRITDPIRYVSSILSINIRYVSRYFLHYRQISLKPTEICDFERSFPGGNFMI